VRAKDLKAGPGDREEVAIKIIRNNETMLVIPSHFKISFGYHYNCLPLISLV